MCLGHSGAGGGLRCAAEARCAAAVPPGSWFASHFSYEGCAAPQVVAELDGAYYALLEHALCCSWAAPAVPPPHAWFPAFAAEHPGTGLMLIRHPPQAHTCISAWRLV